MKNVRNALWNARGEAQNVLRSIVCFKRFVLCLILQLLNFTYMLTAADTLFFVPVLPVARTTKRAQTLYDGQPTSPPGVCHIPMAEPFCNRTREVSKKPRYL